jgi:flagellar protein FlbD
MEARVIMLTRLNGPPFALNPDLIERADATPDTVVTLVGGTKYVISESLEQLRNLVIEFRSQVISSAHAYEATVPPPARQLRVVPATEPESPSPPVREV